MGQIIAFTGGMRTGKDTCANMLYEMMGRTNVSKPPLYKWSIAYRIKELAYKVLYDQDDRVNEDCVIGFDEQYKPKLLSEINPLYSGSHTLRDFYKWIAEGVKQFTHDDFWIYNVLWTVDGTIDLIIPDMRRLHEQEAIKAKGGIVIKVQRMFIDRFPDYKGIDPFSYVTPNDVEGKLKEDLSHISESETIPYDYLITNYGDKENLYNQLLTIAIKEGWNVPNKPKL